MTVSYKYKDLSLNSKLNSDVFKSLLIETILSTDVTVYGNITTMKVLTKVINHFSTVWKDLDKFVNLSMNNWMQILLRSDWNDKVIRKIRIYLLSL